MTQALRVRLTGRALRYVTLLQDFGHLDEDALTELLIAVTEMRGTPAEAPVDLPLVRRVAAMWLFDAEGGVSPDGVLSEDWPLLFS